MAGENNLQILLRSASPIVNTGAYVYCTLPDPGAAILSQSVVIVREREGTTLVLPQAIADAQGIDYEYVAGWITLEVHSSLSAVGLTAAFSSALAQRGISCNVVAGFYHDHIFVDLNDTDRAVEVIRKLSEQ